VQNLMRIGTFTFQFVKNRKIFFKKKLKIGHLGRVDDEISPKE